MGNLDAIMNTKAYRPEASRIVFSTEARGLQSHSKAPRPKQSAADIKAQEDVMRVALDQPHRRGYARDAAEAAKAGSMASRLSEPLGRFCASQWPNDENWRLSMMMAGDRYDQLVRDSLIALGLPYIGQSGGINGGELLLDDEAQARKEVTLRYRRRADEELRRIEYALPSKMERLCYNKFEPSPYDLDKLRHGLFLLADLFKTIDRGINNGRSD